VFKAVEEDDSESITTYNEFKKLLLIWNLLRLTASKEKIYAIFFGWGVSNRDFQKLKKTLLTYLPSINLSITFFDTIYKLFEMMQTRAFKAKMTYINMTLDVGAYVNAYRVLCNYPEKFPKLILYLGDFHLMKEVFGSIGKLVAASGFEDVVFQAKICYTGSLDSVFSGVQYNRCWFV